MLLFRKKKDVYWFYNTLIMRNEDNFFFLSETQSYSVAQTGFAVWDYLSSARITGMRHTWLSLTNLLLDIKAVPISHLCKLCFNGYLLLKRWRLLTN